MWVKIASCACILLLASQAAAAEDASEGAQLAATCAACHAPNGSDKGIPSITGLDEQKIIAAMSAYKANERPNHVMHAVALSLSEEELATVARYLADRGRDRNP